MPFRYLRDSLFLTAFCLYWFNRLVLKPLVPHGFLHNHFNDLLCIPFFVPIVVFVARVCRLRDHDRPPQAHEVLLPLMVWSIMFELYLPQHPFWSQWVVGDPYDVLWYCVGAMVASTWWRTRYPAGNAPLSLRRDR